jgi:hypothetical protein
VLLSAVQQPLLLLRLRLRLLLLVVVVVHATREMPSRL